MTGRSSLASFRAAVNKVLPRRVQRWIIAAKTGTLLHPKVGQVDFGDLRRDKPLSRMYGWDRGTPVDRYYIEMFLKNHAGLIQGDVLEISEDTYTRKFGGDRVSRNEVLHYDDPSPPATLVGDLTDAPHIADNQFDCIIITQTLMLIYDLPKAIETLHRILKPGGTVIATMAGVTAVADPDWRHIWYWSFSESSGRRMFEDGFPGGAVEAVSFGNVLSATGFLQGLAMEELTTSELDLKDPDYQLLVGVVARKADGDQGS